MCAVCLHSIREIRKTICLPFDESSAWDELRDRVRYRSFHFSFDVQTQSMMLFNKSVKRSIDETHHSTGCVSIKLNWNCEFRNETRLNGEINISHRNDDNKEYGKTLRCVAIKYIPLYIQLTYVLGQTTVCVHVRTYFFLFFVDFLRFLLQSAQHTWVNAEASTTSNAFAISTRSVHYKCCCIFRNSSFSLGKQFGFLLFLCDSDHSFAPIRSVIDCRMSFYRWNDDWRKMFILWFSRCRKEQNRTGEETD